MASRTTRIALGFAAFQAADALACAVPLAYVKKDLDRLGCPASVQRRLPAIKGASALGLAAGLKMPKLGVLTSAALVGYFACAVGVHVRAGDAPIRAVPAASLGALATGMLLAVYRPALTSN